ncbi:MAG TPA: nuclear transport factor 2 family protein, partial [Terriglobales bacterium]|nr:nuclear transport factor 2 family protein [Terriglobales bacterium]
MPIRRCVTIDRALMVKPENLHMTDDLAKRIDRLESIEAIKKLKHVYMHYCDLGYPPEKLGPLFADDAVWSGRDFGHHVGRPAIEAFFGGVS